MVRTAGTFGIPAADVDRVIGLLASAGVLDDYPAALRAALPDYLRGRIGPEMACAALAYGHADGGAAVLARRKAAFTRIHGGGRVGACVTTFLAVRRASPGSAAWTPGRRSRPTSPRRAWAPLTSGRDGPSGSPARCTGWPPRYAPPTTPGGCRTWP